MERREFLKVFSGGVLLMSSSLPLAASKGTEGKTLRIGVIADVRPQVCVGNAAEIREIIDAHPNVLAVFQGHHHPGHYSWKNGTHYLTFQGMIENAFPEHNSYAVVEIKQDGDIIVEGYKDCPDRILPADTE